MEHFAESATWKPSHGSFRPATGALQLMQELLPFPHSDQGRQPHSTSAARSVEACTLSVAWGEDSQPVLREWMPRRRL